jgi:hypothetical protein
MNIGKQKPIPIFKSAFRAPSDGYVPELNRKPVVFDILAPDHETSILPDNVVMVLHVNPASMSLNYAKVIQRINTRGGFVEQHWGEGLSTIEFNMATGGFVRLYSGMSNITGGLGAINTEGNRRETIAYDKYLDMLALFHNNGSIYDASGQIVFQGFIKVTFDGGIYYGWFNNFNVTETVEQPYMFSLTASFQVESEVQRFRSMPYKNLTENVSPLTQNTNETTVRMPASVTNTRGGSDVG